MADSPNRTEAWVQWAGIILAIVGAVWNMATRVSRIEQQLTDDASFHADESRRVNELEKHFTQLLENQARNRVAH